MIQEKPFNKEISSGKGTFIIANDIARTFNNIEFSLNFKTWKNTSEPLKKFEHESYSFSVIHRKSREYQFKYLIDSSIWLNRVTPDKKVINKFRSENSVVVL